MKNKDALQTLFGASNCQILENGEYIKCEDDVWFFAIRSYGAMEAKYDNHECLIFADENNVYCE